MPEEEVGAGARWRRPAAAAEFRLFLTLRTTYYEHIMIEGQYNQLLDTGTDTVFAGASFLQC